MNPAYLNLVRYLGLMGTLIVIISSAISGVMYRGSKGERFSVLNHFVSELGEVGVSKGARLFNYALIAGGLLLIPFLIGLGLLLNTWWGWLGSAAGTAAGLSLAAVGMFPMNNLEKHSLAAMTYFRTGLAMVGIFGLAFLFQPEGKEIVPSWSVWISLAAAASYGSFLFLIRPKPEENPVDILDPQGEKERPEVWTLPVVEWLIFGSTVFWLFGIAFSI